MKEDVDVDSLRLFVGRRPEPDGDWEFRLGDRVLARLSDDGARIMAEYMLRILDEVKP